MAEQQEKQESRVVQWLNSAAEASATLVPLIALVVGVGMVRLLPPKLATPLFYSEEDNERFLSRMGMESLSDVPLVLVASQCGGACDDLRAQLTQHGVTFDELDIDTQYGRAYFLKAAEASGSNDLPKVIVGASLVRPDALSVKRFVESNAQAAK